ncbi:MAG: hypothetical protein NVS3B17_06210 [Vulcanimicrobiaceae bacterium]
MSDTSEPSGTGEAPEDDGALRVYSEQLGIDFDSVVERAKRWRAENPLPSDIGPEPFNVGKPRPPVD